MWRWDRGLEGVPRKTDCGRFDEKNSENLESVLLPFEIKYI
jgi:hypothetical protein